MRHYYDNVTDTNGTSVGSATVTVYLTGTVTKATLYSDDGVTVIGNPVTSDTLGRFNFYVDDGRYDLTIAGTGIVTYTQVDVEIMDWKSKPTVLAHMTQGADAGAKIVAAIALLPSTGGTVDARGFEGAQVISSTISIGTATKPVALLLGAATFTTSGIIYLYDNSSIEGQGDITVLKMANSVNLKDVVSVNTNPESATVPLRTAVRNLTIDGNTANNPGGPSVDWGIVIGNSSATGQSTFCRVENVRVINTSLDGVYINNVSDNWVSNCLFESTLRAAVRCEGSLTAKNLRNHIRGNTVTNYGGFAIQGINVNYTEISNNTIQGTSRTGCPAPVATSLEAINVSNGNNNSIVGNTINTTGAEGISLTNELGAAGASNVNSNVIIGNTILNPWSIGIHIAPGNTLTGTFYGNVIADNTIWNPMQLLEAAGGCVAPSGIDGGIRVWGRNVIATYIAGNVVIESRTTRRVNYAVVVDTNTDQAIDTIVGLNWLRPTDTAGTWGTVRDNGSKTKYAFFDKDDITYQLNRALRIASPVSSTAIVVANQSGADTFKIATETATAIVVRDPTAADYWWLALFANADANPGRLKLAKGNVIIESTGKTAIATLGGAPTSNLQVAGLVNYANNAAAVAAGLTAGAFYRNNADPDLVCVVH